MKIVCPTSAVHDRFIVTAHVAEVWLTDCEGSFLETFSCEDVIHEPGLDDVWRCAICNAIVEEISY